MPAGARIRALNCPKANVMVYGPGFAGALDVVGHEVTHGIIAHEADLVYADESGAVNEALADIFGTLIEFQARTAPAIGRSERACRAIRRRAPCAAWPSRT